METALRIAHGGCRRLAIEFCAMRRHFCDAAARALPVPVEGVSSLDLGSLAVLVTLFLDVCCDLRRCGPILILFRSGPIGVQFLKDKLVEAVGDHFQVMRNCGE
jgi:hypothetical protein